MLCLILLALLLVCALVVKSGRAAGSGRWLYTVERVSDDSDFWMLEAKREGKSSAEQWQAKQDFAGDFIHLDEKLRGREATDYELVGCFVEPRKSDAHLVLIYRHPAK